MITPEKGFFDKYDDFLWVYDSMTNTTTHTRFPGNSSGFSQEGVYILYTSEAQAKAPCANNKTSTAIIAICIARGACTSYHSIVCRVCVAISADFVVVCVCLAQGCHNMKA
eukprot:3404480-Amphidinium_carterae.1